MGSEMKSATQICQIVSISCIFGCRRESTVGPNWMVCQVSGDAYWFQSFDFWARVGSLNPTWPLVNSRMRLSPQDSTWNSRHQKLLWFPSETISQWNFGVDWSDSTPSWLLYFGFFGKILPGHLLKKSERGRNEVGTRTEKSLDWVGTKSERDSCTRNEVGTTLPTADHHGFTWFPDLFSSSGLGFI